MYILTFHSTTVLWHSYSFKNIFGVGNHFYFECQCWTGKLTLRGFLFLFVFVLFCFVLFCFCFCLFCFCFCFLRKEILCFLPYSSCHHTLWLKIRWLHADTYVLSGPKQYAFQRKHCSQKTRHFPRPMINFKKYGCLDVTYGTNREKQIYLQPIFTALFNIESIFTLTISK